MIIWSLQKDDSSSLFEVSKSYDQLNFYVHFDFISISVPLLIENEKDPIISFSYSRRYSIPYILEGSKIIMCEF